MPSRFRCAAIDSPTLLPEEIRARVRGFILPMEYVLTPTVICVPVRNEEGLLPNLILGCERLHAPGPVALCLYFDACTDGSERIARAMASGSPLPIAMEAGPPDTTPNAGRARAAAFALGLRRLTRTPDAMMMSTDADSVPAADWIDAARSALRHADIAAGRVIRSLPTDEAAQDRQERYYDRLHAHRRTIDPVPWEAQPGCHQASGANLAMHVGAYRAAGGFRDLPSGEDAVFLDDARRTGLRVRHDRAMVVQTSSRRDGRAPGGLACALAELDAGRHRQVPDPSAADWQYRGQRDARRAFATIDRIDVRERLGAIIGLSADHILGVARDCPNAEAFGMRIVPAAPGGERLVPLTEAERILSTLERRALGRAA